MPWQAAVKAGGFYDLIAVVQHIVQTVAVVRMHGGQKPVPHNRGIGKHLLCLLEHTGLEPVSLVSGMYDSHVHVNGLQQFIL